MALCLQIEADITIMRMTMRTATHKFAALALVCFAVVMTATAALAQQNPPGKITGTVKDATGAIVGGAEVSLPNAQSIMRTTLTTADGKFTMDDVAPGSYAVVVNKSGFARLSTAVQVKPGDQKELDLVLEVNALSAEVTVTAEAGRFLRPAPSPSRSTSLPSRRFWTELRR
jgi:hypothetical protein